MFSRIINGEDLFRAPIFDGMDGVVLRSFLVIGDTRYAKLKKFFGNKGIKLPSHKIVKEQEEELMIEIQETETIGNIYNSISNVVGMS